MNDNNIMILASQIFTIDDYITLLNSLVPSLKLSPLTNLKELLNEKLFYSLIIEIEPSLETSINNKNFLFNNLDSKQKTFNQFLVVIEKFIINNQNQIKEKFSNEINFTKKINYDLLIQENKTQLIFLIEILCLLTFVSVNKNLYIDKINSIQNIRISNLYYTIIDKYIIVKNEEDNNNKISINKNYTFSTQLQKIKLEYEKQIKHLSNLYKNEKNQLNNITKQLNDFKEKIKNLEIENQKLQKKIEIIPNNKNTNENNTIRLSGAYGSLSICKNACGNISGIPKIEDYKDTMVEGFSLISFNNGNNNKEMNDLKKMCENLKNENENLNKKIEKMGLEKEKLEIQIEKSELSIQKIQLDNDRIKDEKKTQEKEYKEIISKDKNLIEKLKKDIYAQKKINEKNINDKKNLQKELDKYKNEMPFNSMANYQKRKCSPVSPEYNEEFNNLKNDVQKLKTQLTQKELKIKELEELNLEYEKEKGEDIDFYKKSYEEQKIRVNEEHKLISESLYKLAVHFMTLKDDLQKKINSSNNEK